MKPTDFNFPTEHPYGMLEGYSHASEKEGLLKILLTECVVKNEFVSFETYYEHPSMVEDGLLEKVGDHKYKLTKKALGLLYSVYGK